MKAQGSQHLEREYTTCNHWPGIEHSQHSPPMASLLPEMSPPSSLFIALNYLLTFTAWLLLSADLDNL